MVPTIVAVLRQLVVIFIGFCSNLGLLVIKEFNNQLNMVINAEDFSLSEEVVILVLAIPANPSIMAPWITGVYVST